MKTTTQQENISHTQIDKRENLKSQKRQHFTNWKEWVPTVLSFETGGVLPAQVPPKSMSEGYVTTFNRCTHKKHTLTFCLHTSHSINEENDKDSRHLSFQICCVF